MSEEEGQPEWLRNDGGDAGNAGGEMATSATTNENFSLSLSTSNSSTNNKTPLPLLQKLQQGATILSLLLSPVSIILVGLSAHAWGGVAWSEGNASKVFNWHPILMICAYAFMNVGVLIFRITKTSSYQQRVQKEKVDNDSNFNSTASTIGGAPTKKQRGIAKFTHGTIWTCAFLFGTVAMLAVFKSHNDPVSGYIANLYSLHSWIGIFVLTLYSLQFLYGIMAFGGLLSKGGRLNHPIIMEIHKFTGSYLHILVTATILMGIQEKEGFVGCSYTVENGPDLVPLNNLGLIPQACKLSHGLGLVVLAMGLLTSFALSRLPVV